MSIQEDPEFVGTDQESKAFMIFRQRYIQIYPPPERPGLRRLRGDWQFLVFVALSIASVLLASLRTAEMFYRSAASSNVYLAWAEAVLAMFTVEASIVAYSASLSSEAQAVSRRALYAGIALLGAISIVAALGQSISLVEVAPVWVGEYTQYALAILIGPGASLAALLAGHILGLQIAKLRLASQEDLQAYRAQLEVYQARLAMRWKRSSEYQALAADKQAVLPEPAPAAVQAPPTAGRGEAKQMILEWLEKQQLAVTDTGIQPVEIARALGLSDSTVRTTLFRLRQNGGQNGKPNGAGDGA